MIVYNSTENAPSDRIKWEATATNSYTYNVWNHWVITWSPTDGVFLYINGVLWAQQATSVSTSHHMGDTMFIGKLHALWWTQVMLHSNTLRQGMNPELLPDWTENGSWRKIKSGVGLRGGETEKIWECGHWERKVHLKCFCLASYFSGNDENFIGYFDNFQLWDQKIQMSQITALYNSYQPDM